MGVHPIESGSVLAPVLTVPADGNVKAKRYTEHGPPKVRQCSPFF